MPPRRLILAAVVPSAVAIAACGGHRKADADSATTAKATAGRLDGHPRRRRFRPLPSFKPTGICLVARHGARLTDDKILVTPRPDRKRNPNEQIGRMILSTDGKLLWYEPRPDKVHDLKVIDIGGRRALAFWQRHGSGGSYYQLLDEHYRPIGRVRAGHGFATDLHELAVGADGNAWLSADVLRHGILEYVVQEIDIAT